MYGSLVEPIISKPTINSVVCAAPALVPSRLTHAGRCVALCVSYVDMEPMQALERKLIQNAQNGTWCQMGRPGVRCTLPKLPNQNILWEQRMQGCMVWHWVRHPELIDSKLTDIMGIGAWNRRRDKRRLSFR